MEGPLLDLSGFFKNLDVKISQTIIVCVTAFLIVSVLSMRSCIIEEQHEKTERLKALHGNQDKQ